MQKSFLSIVLLMLFGFSKAQDGSTLEGKVLDTEIKDSYNKEHILKSSLFDILHGCREFIKEDELSIRFRETPRIDFKTSVENIISFIEKMCEDNNINLLND
jgi:hypothetical protein